MMTPPVFKAMKDARAWVNADAIAHAVLPFRPLVSGEALEALTDFLEFTIATHPEVRRLATRAAKALVPPVVGVLRAAARKADDDDDDRSHTSPREARIEPGLIGRPKLDREDYYKESLAIVKSEARYVCTKWGRSDFDDLVGEAWVLVCEIAPAWDASKASYQGYLWARVRARLLDYAKKRSNRFEKPASWVWTDDVHDSQFTEKEPGARFRAAIDAAAMSYGLALLPDPPEWADARSERREVSAILQRAIGTLTPRKADIIRRSFYEGEKLGAIAQTLGVSLITVRRDRQEALEELHAILGGETNLRALRPASASQAAKKAPAKKRSTATKKPTRHLVSNRKPNDEAT